MSPASTASRGSPVLANKALPSESASPSSIPGPRHASSGTEGTLRDIGEFGGAHPRDHWPGLSVDKVGARKGTSHCLWNENEESGGEVGRFRIGVGEVWEGDTTDESTDRDKDKGTERARGKGVTVGTLPGTPRAGLGTRTGSERNGPLIGGGLLPSNKSGRSIFRPSGGSSIRKGKAGKNGKIPLQPRTLSDLLTQLTPSERSFFTKLDAELDKVESFYEARAKEARDKAAVLLNQVDELKEHREAYYTAYPRTTDRWPNILTTTLSRHVLSPPSNLPHLGIRRFFHPDGDQLSVDVDTREEREGEELDPHGYLPAKKKIKIALQEYYRGLELLENYRILNLTGFRKALKKFEKTTGILFAQELYMSERVDPLPLCRAEPLHTLRVQMEIVYADRFAKGDRKRARDRLRQEVIPKTHHFSTFRAGVYVGLAIPAIVLGIVRSFDPYVRNAVPEWASLLNIYGVLFILPIFTFLIGLNMCAWTRARINWVFIFDLDVRSVLDYREFFELPAFLFMTLSYCCFFSFYLVDNPRVDPHTWPLAWVVLSILVLINPLPIWRRRSRYWFLYMIARLLVSGTTRVEFADFWLGDQLCTLAYTLGNLYVFGCAYNNNWNSVSALCGTANTWIAAFLSALPYGLRFSQCVRRWADSGLKIHLVNAGKYLSMIVVYIVYYHWRHLGQFVLRPSTPYLTSLQGSGRDTSFVVYVLFATLGSIYTCAWDLLMDWSFMRPKAPWPFLRDDLIYGKEAVPLYYFAIVSNIILRLDWVFYIPTGGLSLTVRAWLFACLEALRRFQWNFYRVENEHIGNADRYRVTKEIPLPYSVRPGDDADDADDSDDERPSSIRTVLGGRGGRSPREDMARSSSYRGRNGLEEGIRERAEANRVVEQEL
ncbi:EXS-domain-containing protein [Dacryopinax primogenitus]|uniref:EXS-domain-containing protein n=1 Tax=Dacryopinax primogenitus (strain DJM 731) TaxID=1858805 RepID=M5FZQ6_DACPD|nr:EXS-domain-containing protein [Dacryopinax primogenitus]EJT99046.1 EXS-domain-containing protein [Dacryopinax primogenitus]